MTTSRFTKADVEVQKQQREYDGFFQIDTFTLRHRRFAGDWSPSIKREIVLRTEAVGVLLYDPVLDSVALVEQFRIGAMTKGDSPWLIELVAGLIDSGETPEQVARREALEEAGCTVLEMEPVLNYYSSPGASNEYFYLYCGRCDLSNAGGIHGLADEHEDIRVHVLAFDTVLQRLAAGELCNAHTIIGLQWLQLNRDRLRRLWR
jgi:ADP-ribose pyrophosphatase